MRILKDFIKNIFYTPKHSAPEEVKIFRMLLPSFAGMIICAFCLFGSSWAWFTGTQTVGIANITSGSWKIESAFINGEYPANALNEETPTDQEGVISFYAEANTDYEVEISVGGTVTSGYLIINIGEETYYINDFIDKTAKFVVNLTEDNWVNIHASWGSVPAGNEDKTFLNGEKIGGGLVCTCIGKCSAENVEVNCELCYSDEGYEAYYHCKGTECTCDGEEKCTEENRNGNCELCNEHYELCAVTKWVEGELTEESEEPQEETTDITLENSEETENSNCTCDVPCTEGSAVLSCPVCSENYENCAKKENENVDLSSEEENE